MARKKKEKTRVELATEEINEVLGDYKCNLWSVPRFVPSQREDGKIVWEIHTEIKVTEIKDEQEAKSK